jgi:hypothetical protein
MEKAGRECNMSTIGKQLYQSRPEIKMKSKSVAILSREI